jgi:AAA15 family ATPase/GTPase
MIVDLTIANFRSFEDQQTFSMNVEGAQARHRENFSLFGDGKLAVLRSAAILGPNASGKSNLLRAFRALQWIVESSGNRGEGKRILPYEPFKLAPETQNLPVLLEMEFIVPSGVRYRYSVSFFGDRIAEESLYSFARGQRARVFHRDSDDTWDTVKFGGTYKGGNRKFPFFPNNAYLSRAGGDASAPASIREVYRYFERITFIRSGGRIFVPGYMNVPENMRAVTDLICLADTGVANVTAEKNDKAKDIKLPDDMPDDIKEAIHEENRVSYKFWAKSTDGQLIEFNQDEMSEGTVRLFEMLPVVLMALENGSPLIIDEMDAHFHPNLLKLILWLFHDNETNSKGAQVIFTAHDTNVLDSKILRRDQLWFVTKDNGASKIRALDEYDKKYVRSDSPFESFYMDGRLGALPKFSYGDVKQAVLKVVMSDSAEELSDSNA